MNTIIDYAVQNGRFTFAEKPFNAVDSLILSQLSYLGFDAVASLPRLGAKQRRLSSLPSLLADQELFYTHLNETGIRLLFLAVISAPRFRDITVDYFECKTDVVEEKQFSAVCFFLNGRDAYVAFRGTDNTLVGWKEDFNMAYMDAIPSQLEARAYLEKVARKISGSIIVGGHSKGGNLAVYAAVTAETRRRQKIIAVYNHDGPGFSRAFLDAPEFAPMADKIHTTMPRSAVVGMILQQHETYKVVCCSSSGLLQHDGFSWNVAGDDFEYGDSLDFSSQVTHRALNKWLAGLDSASRRRFVDVLYNIIKSSNAQTMEDLKNNWKESTLAILKYASALDAETKRFLLHALKLMAVYSVESAFTPAAAPVKALPKASKHSGKKARK